MVFSFLKGPSEKTVSEFCDPKETIFNQLIIDCILKILLLLSMIYNGGYILFNGSMDVQMVGTTDDHSEKSPKTESKWSQ